MTSDPTDQYHFVVYWSVTDGWQVDCEMNASPEGSIWSKTDEWHYAETPYEILMEETLGDILQRKMRSSHGC